MHLCHGLLRSIAMAFIWSLVRGWAPSSYRRTFSQLNGRAHTNSNSDDDDDQSLNGDIPYASHSSLTSSGVWTLRSSLFILFISYPPTTLRSGDVILQSPPRSVFFPSNCLSR